MKGETVLGPQWTRDELFLARAIAFLSAERHKIDNPALYACYFAAQYLDEAKRVLGELNK